ncbi:Hypothetical predicted protein [Lecanosticta acicola]|uniref:YMC020W-like alpha/beta hydrolase domain-containing protein n=1 Tax=Lecanosticta acicola TaxID=111012 RepID=A0AAI9E838_9PEZI|nr:Hypothetical predicted protein [Lecanosticta acicola]
MAPARKKSKLANENGTELLNEDRQSGKDSDATAKQPPQRPAPIDTNQADDTHSQPSLPLGPSPQQQAQNRGSWYSASAWKGKASPVAQVARESISVDKGVSSESSHQEAAKRRPSQSVSKSFRGSSRKSIPLAAEPTRVHANPSEVSLPPKQQKRNVSGEKEAKGADTTTTIPEVVKEQEAQAEEAPLPPEPEPMGDVDAKAETASLRPAPGPWFGWWSRPDGYGSDGEKVKNAAKAQLDGAAEEASNTPLPENIENPMEAAPTQNNADGEADDQLRPEMGRNNTGSRSWFRLWSRTQNEQAQEEERQRRESEQHDQQQPLLQIAAEPARAAEDLKPAEALKKPKKDDEEDRPKSSGWAFWSKDRSKDAAPTPEGADTEVGELAVADTPSQSHPEAAQFNQEREQRKQDKAELKRSSSLLRPKRGRPEKADNLSGDTTAAVTPIESQNQTPAVSQFQTPKETPEASPAPVARGKKSVQLRPNIVLPLFRDTYPAAPNPGVMSRLAEYVAQTLHIPGYESRPPPHPFISPSPPKVKKAIAIGVHGFFPAALLQRVLGQPTGTSIRFANHAAAAIKQWCHDRQPEVKDVEVEKVALEGEGLIADRVSTLWKLLLNWLSHLRQADFILVACHSQGVPVSLMLVAKLIQLGCLSSYVRIGICAMAGINLGPFSEYKSRLFGGTALELFDFCDSNSKVSMAYADSLEICLRHGVRVTYVGSIDDQLVSLESSLHTPLRHPYVSRSVFVDGRLHTSNFLTHLVAFAVKLRNLGVSDHGLLREISAPLAGSLVGGDGHSRVYDDPIVYRNAIDFALETTDVHASAFEIPADSISPEEKRKSMEAASSRRASLAGYPSNMTAANSMRRGSLSSLSLKPPGIAPIIAAYEAPGASAEKNPFVLPWAVRGMLGEELVKRDPKLQEEVRELVKEFETWRPTRQVLKDVRWRLEGVRSML